MSATASVAAAISELGIAGAGIGQAAIALISLIIGIMVGTTGIGGFLIIPSFVLFLDLPVRQAVGSALGLAAFSGLLGVWMFSRRGTLDWALARPLVISAAVLTVVGGWASAYLSVSLITGLLGLIVGLGSAAAYLRTTGRIVRAWDATGASAPHVVSAIGGVSGLVSGVTGAGGPVVSIPLMVACGFAPLLANGVGTLLQIVAGTAGMLVYGWQGLVSMHALACSLPFQLLGISLGIALAHRLDPVKATRWVAAIGFLAGMLLIHAAYSRAA